MNLNSQVKDAINNIFVAKMRSILSVLGILIGTASIVAMILGGELAARQALLQFKNLGTDLLAISISSANHDAKKTQSKSLDSDTVFNLQREFPQNILNIAPYTNLYGEFKFMGKKIDGGSVVGVTENLFAVTNSSLIKGRYIYYVDGMKSFCMIGKKIYDQLKKYVDDPLGKQILVGQNIFTIVGILDTTADNSFIYINMDNAIFIPIKKSVIFNKDYSIDNVVLKLNENSDINKVENIINKYFAKNYSDGKLYIRSAQQFIHSMAEEKEILTVFLGFIGSISLLVGGIGVMNIMLVSVTERRREIGIRLAIGAKRRDIKSLFLVEAIILSLLGGIIGVVIGIAIAFIIALFKHWEFTLFFMPPILGFTVSVCVGIFFGFYPALKAAKLNPIETLRSD